MTSPDCTPVVKHGDVPVRRQHPAYLAIGAGQVVRGLIPVIAVSVFSAPWWVLPLIAVGVVVIALVMWLTSTYAVVDGELRVRTGLVATRTRAIPVRRITAVDAQRGVVQRVLRVWGVKVQTPGDGDKSSVRLHSLSHARLDELLEALRADRRAPAPSDDTGDTGAGAVPAPPAVEGRTVARLDTRALLVAAVTGTSVPLILAGLGAVVGRAQEVLPDRYERWLEGTLAGRSVVALVGIGVGVLLIAVVAGIALTALRLSGFTLRREDDRLRTSRGLLSQRNGTVVVDRVQAVRLVEGVWRRLLGYCAVEVEVAGIGAKDEGERMLFPLVRRSAVRALLADALPELGWADTAPTGVPPRVRRRYLALPLAWSVPPAAAALLLPGGWAVLAALPVVLALVVGRAQGRDAGWSVDDRTVVLRYRRVLARHTVVARRRRVQVTETRATPWQRRAHVAGLALRLSSTRTAVVRALEADVAADLQRRVGRREVGPGGARRATARPAAVPAPQ